MYYVTFKQDISILGFLVIMSMCNVPGMMKAPPKNTFSQFLSNFLNMCSVLYSVLCSVNVSLRVPGMYCKPLMKMKNTVSHKFPHHVFDEVSQACQC